MNKSNLNYIPSQRIDTDPDYSDLERQIEQF